MSWMALAIGDIETTGLDQSKGARIIEVALSCWAYNTVTGERRPLGKPYLQRINPGIPIDPGAEAVHGISLAQLRGKPDWNTVGPVVGKILSKCKLFIAHNVSFDATFLALELIRIGQPMPTFDIFCTMENGRRATGFGKVPNLGELAFACGIEYEPEKAHGALYDTTVLEQSYWKGVEIGLFNNPGDLVK